MNYTEARNYITSLSTFGINLGLERIRELLKRLGNPHKDIKFIHIGGTNGKGSTAKMLSCILSEAKLKTGLFTSPHLHEYEERISINGNLIAKKDIANLVSKIAPHIDNMQKDNFECPTEFEVSTVMALVYFAQQKVDWAIMEVGLGGEIDSTNIIDSDLAIITSIAMDHMNYLGNNIAEIAKVKSGIIKKNTPLIIGVQEEPALSVLKNAAKDKNAPYYIVNQNFKYQLITADKKSQTFNWQFKNINYENLKINFLGNHQVANASLAVMAANLLNIPANAIYSGLDKAFWPGRLELIEKDMSILLDGAHNVQGIESLIKTLDLLWPKTDKIKKIFVLGMLADKEREKSLELLMPYMDTVIVTKPPVIRGENWEDLAKICKKANKITYTEKDINQACAQAISLAKKSNSMIIVTGSLYMLADARKYFLNN